MIHCRMLEMHYLNLEIVLYTWIEHPSYANVVEFEVGEIMIMYLDPMLEQGNFGVYMKNIWLTVFGIFSKYVMKLS